MKKNNLTEQTCKDELCAFLLEERGRKTEGRGKEWVSVCVCECVCECVCVYVCEWVSAFETKMEILIQSIAQGFLSTLTHTHNVMNKKMIKNKSLRPTVIIKVTINFRHRKCFELVKPERR